MIKSDFGKVEINCKGHAMMMAELTSAISGVADTLRKEGRSEDEIRKEIDRAVKFAFMSHDELIDEAAKKISKDLKAALKTVSEDLKHFLEDCEKDGEE